ncbi:MAG TPA: GDSL-type esterase/lipase family protein, partial [Polyangia bacterium]|nr:GDSL-type esterase/lipase family protein [Polyangia bacterium]
GGNSPTGGASGDNGASGSAGAGASGGAALTGSGGASGSVGAGGSSPTGGAGGTSETGGGGGGNAGTSPTGAAGQAGSPPASGDMIPAGYPAPTADNFTKCTTVQPAGGVCPGGGNGPVCMECLFGGNMFATTNVATPTGMMLAGNYAVTVQLGGAAAGQTFISAEGDRGLLHSVTTSAGQSVEYAFVVNVRASEGQPEEKQAGAGYPGLDLYFSGPTATPPQVSAIGYTLVTPATKPVMVYMASDSTECDQGEDNSAFGGWGQMLPEYFAPPVGIANYGDSGESSSSFYGKSDMWGAIKAHWTAGDWVIVQFGHNDKGVADSVVQANLEKYVADALAANVTPILVSPPARVGTWNGAVLGDQSSLHAAAAAAAAAAKKVAYIDLTALSTTWYNSLGSKAAALKFHANGSDGTHTNLAGADVLAGLVAGEIKTQSLGLAKYLRP